MHGLECVLQPRFKQELYKYLNETVRITANLDSEDQLTAVRTRRLQALVFIWWFPRPGIWYMVVYYDSSSSITTSWQLRLEYHFAPA